MPVETPPEESVSKAAVEQGKHSIAKTESSAANTIYTCPMHPEVQQDHPGNCPKCGMALELKTISAVEEWKWKRAQKRGEWRSGIGSHICSRFGSAEIMSPDHKLGVLK